MQVQPATRPSLFRLETVDPVVVYDVRVQSLREAHKRQGRLILFVFASPDRGFALTSVRVPWLDCDGETIEKLVQGSRGYHNER